jgi:hypothetical protein
MPESSNTAHADSFGLTTAKVADFIAAGCPHAAKGIRNFYLSAAPAYGPKTVVSVLSGQPTSDFHAYDAVLALLELGFGIRAKRGFGTHSELAVFEPFIKSGLLQFDEQP